jgi:hypothetical protein
MCPADLVHVNVQVRGNLSCIILSFVNVNVLM